MVSIRFTLLILVDGMGFLANIKYLFINYNDTGKVIHNSCIKIFWGNKLIIGMICVCHHCKIVDPFRF